MAIKKMQLENFTVFEKLDLNIEQGINVLVGENGMGKTHIMKLLYSACQAARHDIPFPQKVVRVFQPDGSSIQRLVRRKNTGGTTSVKITSDSSYISMQFTTQTKRWNAEVMNDTSWERQNSSLESVFIPAKEILSKKLYRKSTKGRSGLRRTVFILSRVTRQRLSSTWLRKESGRLRCFGS